LGRLVACTLAGRHLVHAQRALQGADLLAKIGPALVDRRVAMMTAIPAIERASSCTSSSAGRCATA